MQIPQEIGSFEQIALALLNGLSADDLNHIREKIVEIALDGKVTDDEDEELGKIIRDEAYLRGLNELMKQIEDKVGLARGTLSDPKSDVRTAQEVRTNRQKTYVTIATIQRALEKAINDLVTAIDELMTLYNIAPSGAVNVNCSWDDSVVTDPDVERERDRTEVLNGIMDSWEYRAKWYGETEEVAKAAIKSIKEADQTDDEIIGFGNGGNS